MAGFVFVKATAKELVNQQYLVTDVPKTLIVQGLIRSGRCAGRKSKADKKGAILFLLRLRVFIVVSCCDVVCS